MRSLIRRATSGWTAACHRRSPRVDFGAMGLRSLRVQLGDRGHQLPVTGPERAPPQPRENPDAPRSPEGPGRDNRKGQTGGTRASLLPDRNTQSNAPCHALRSASWSVVLLRPRSVGSRPLDPNGFAIADIQESVLGTESIARSEQAKGHDRRSYSRLWSLPYCRTVGVPCSVVVC
jgi:hypothetical protein